MFVKEYLVDLNATQAAIRAGYSEKTANRIGPELLVKTCIATEVQKAMNKRSQGVEVSSDWVLKTIKDTTQACIDDDPVKNASSIFKGGELLGKHLKLFTDKIEKETTITVIRKNYAD